MTSKSVLHIRLSLISERKTAQNPDVIIGHYQCSDIIIDTSKVSDVIIGHFQDSDVIIGNFQSGQMTLLDSWSVGRW